MSRALGVYVLCSAKSVGFINTCLIVRNKVGALIQKLQKEFGRGLANEKTHKPSGNTRNPKLQSNQELENSYATIVYPKVKYKFKKTINEKSIKSIKDRLDKFWSN